MSYFSPSLRPGMTAIAAVIAVCSTPVLAQEVDQNAPVLVLPPAPSSATVNSGATDTTPATVAAPATVPAAPAATAPILPQIAITRAEESAVRENIAPVQTREVSKPARQQPASRTETAAKAATPAPVETQRSTLEPVARVPAEPVVADPVVTAAPPSPAPVAAAPAPMRNQSSLVALVGAGIVALLALSIAFLLMARRRRNTGYVDEVVASEAMVEPVPVAPMAAADPVWTPAAMTATSPAATRLPGDMSRYGRNVQAAYRGPTPENPFLSLKNRLKRARFYDQRERMAQASPITAETTPVTAQQAPLETWRAGPVKGRTETRRPISGAFRPAWQN